MASVIGTALSSTPNRSPAPTGGSSTSIHNPVGNVNTGESGAVMGAGQGALAGVTAGAAFGPVGMVIGGVVGGLAGLFGGGAADRSRMYLRKARKWEQYGKEREAAIHIRDAIRAFRINRAASVASIGAEGAVQDSSAPAGAVGALGAQFAFARAFTEGQMMIEKKATKFYNKANKSAQSAGNTFALLDAVSSTVGAFGSFGGGSSAGVGLTNAQANEGFGQINTMSQSLNLGSRI